MTLVAREILGDLSEPRFAGRRVERLRVDWASAPRRRLRAETDAGTDVAVDLDRGSYLRDGAVLADDGERVVVVERAREQALVVRVSPGLPPDERVAHALRLGHAFGNQHVPLEVEGAEVRVPITTSAELAAATVESLGLPGLELELAEVQLGLQRPLLGHGHHH